MQSADAVMRYEARQKRKNNRRSMRLFHYGFRFCPSDKATGKGAEKGGAHMSCFFENLGRKLGRAAVPTDRKSKWIWQGLGGTEGESLEAELRLATEILDEPELLNWLRGICRRMEESVDHAGYKYYCELMLGDPPNTIGLPGVSRYDCTPIGKPFCRLARRRDNGAKRHSQPKAARRAERSEGKAVRAPRPSANNANRQKGRRPKGIVSMPMAKPKLSNPKFIRFSV
jgi:hypothetical protein